MLPLKDAIFFGPQTSAWIQSKRPSVFHTSLANFTLVCFLNTQCSQESNLKLLDPLSNSWLTKSCSVSPIGCPSLICQSCVVSSSSPVDVIVKFPVIVEPCKKYRFFLIIPFITTKLPREIFKHHLLKWYSIPLIPKHPSSSNLEYIEHSANSSLSPHAASTELCQCPWPCTCCCPCIPIQWMLSQMW